jgi:hypothetical protein
MTVLEKWRLTRSLRRLIDESEVVSRTAPSREATYGLALLRAALQEFESMDAPRLDEPAELAATD